MRTLILLFGLVALLSSCSAERMAQRRCSKCPTVTKTEVRDSVSYVSTVTVRDSLVQLPADSAWLWALLECDSMGRVKEVKTEIVNRDRVRIKYVIKNNVLTATCEVDSMGIFLKIFDRFTTKEADRSVVSVEKVKVDVKPLNWFQRLSLHIGHTITVGLCLLLAFVLVAALVYGAKKVLT